MAKQRLTEQLEQALAEIPVLDVHSHLVGGHLAARGLHDLLLYHMVVTELYSAGCPSGARLTQYPGWASKEEAHARIREALPYVPHVQNTSTAWVLRLILDKLYGWREPITESNWQRLDDIIRERADDKLWQREILDRVKIRRTATEWARRFGGVDDDRLQYSLEWGMFARQQWGEFDTALYELERCWGHSPDSPAPIGGSQRPATDRDIRTLEDVDAAMDHYLSHIPVGQVVSTAVTWSADIDYQVVTPRRMAAALSHRLHAGRAERDVYASYIHELFLSGLEKMGDRIVLQFALGAEPLPYETGAILPQRTIQQLAEIVARHPRLRFNCMLASRHGDQGLCTLARELPNLSLAGYWWHNFFPDSIRQLMYDRFDMVPMNKQVGFFSDAYCVEWAFGKALVVRKQMAKVLADKIEQGQYTVLDAINIAKAVLFESPQSLLGMVPIDVESSLAPKKRYRQTQGRSFWGT